MLNIPGRLNMPWQKVGKLNHMREYEQTVNWGKFLNDAEALLAKFVANYYIKNDLRSFATKQ
jgi:hypothetical protein